MTSIEQAKAAKAFAQEWQGKGYEKGDTHRFWLELLQKVLGVEDPYNFISFEEQVMVDSTNFMDGYIPATKVLIEQKSIQKDLGAPVKQSNGVLLNPYQQALKYIVGLPVSKHPRRVVTCNFREFWIYDMEQPNGEPQKILLENLEKEYYRLQFLVDEGNEHLRREMEVSVKAGELVGMIYDKLLEQYNAGTHSSPSAAGKLGTRSSSPASALGTQVSSPAVSSEGLPSLTQKDTVKDGNPSLLPNADILRSLNILCVRLVFCLYAEDAGLFHSKTAFHDYLAPYRPQDIRRALIDLFQVLDTPLNERDPYLPEDLAAFPYVNGGLFGHRGADGSSARIVANASERSDNATLGNVAHYTADGTPASQAVIIPQFTEELKQLLLDKASADFDWSEISPTIFGAVFESTLNPETRRSGGMHYTSIENIHKVIDPLFMNDLRVEFEGIVARNSRSSQKNVKDGIGSQNGVKERIGTQNGVKDGSPSLLTSQQRQALAAFQDRLASLTFFDPACGSGNFLTETYLSLRRLENEVIQAMYGGANILTFDTLIKVHIGQFYGIEINDFACTVAKTALWIAENQMMQKTSAIAGKPMDFLPLKTNANIHEGNALRMDWASLGARSSSPAVSDTRDAGVPPAENTRDAGVPPADNIATETVASQAVIVAPHIENHCRKYLPHIENQRFQTITFRLYDSVPREIIEQWKNSLNTKEDTEEKKQQNIQLRKLIDQYEDAGIGACYLKDPKVAKIVRDALCFNEGKQYNLINWCIMPNHVHVLIEVLEGYSLTQILYSWRSFTAHAANRYLGRSGQFWMEEYFDRYIRNNDHFRNAMDYIDNNPVKAGLADCPEHWQWCAAGDALGTRESSPAETQYIAGGTPASQAVSPVENFATGTIASQAIPQAFDYIIGNPPFVGAAMQSKEQKAEIQNLFLSPSGKVHKKAGILDYVAGWYYKAAQYMYHHPMTRAALVSTNSITQGELVPALWKPLMDWYGVQIDFAYRTFKWDSEADIKAHVHCVIIGFHYRDTEGIAKGCTRTPLGTQVSSPAILGTQVSPPAESTATGTVASQAIAAGETPASQATKRIFLSDNQTLIANNINPYLIDAPNIFIESRTKPLCDVPLCTRGNQPTDGGNLIIEASDYEDFIRKEPNAKQYIKHLIGAKEFINRRDRYCLWLVGVSPKTIREMPLVLDRVRKVREMRLASTFADTRAMADTPATFRETWNPDTYIVIPRVSSENRRYVPIGFLDKNTIPTDSVIIIPSATLYHFGVLTSNVHMAWMRVVCGRLEMRYRYSKDIVYNNFPWPTWDILGTRVSPPAESAATEIVASQAIAAGGTPASQVARITQTAQAILDARAKYPDSSLADLYDEVTMPPELRKAHQENDRAVMAAYGFSPKMTESECVAELFKMYQELTKIE